MTFLRNKDNTYSKDEVDVRLRGGTVLRARAAYGGWMGATKERPYPDFEEVEDNSRIERDDLYMGIAHLFKRRSTCVRGQVGCVAVMGNHIVCAGYNGAPQGMKHCTEVGCGGAVVVREAQLDPLPGGEMPRPAESQALIEYPNGCTRSVHAEQNLVAFAARKGVSLEGCAIYCTAGPCIPCAQAMISCGMVRLVYETPYRVKEGLELVNKANVEIVHYAS